MNIRQFAVRAVSVTAVAAAAAFGLTAPATAAPAPAPIVHLAFNGPLMPTLGQNAFCNGIIDTRIETDPERPGIAKVGLSSQGMHGLDPDWSKHPSCKVNVAIVWGMGLITGTIREIDVEFGPTPSEITWEEIPTGSGPQLVQLMATYVDAHYTRLQPQISVPVQAGILVP